MRRPCETRVDRAPASLDRLTRITPRDDGDLLRFPYLLPNLFAAGLALAAVPMSHLFLYETHPPRSARGHASQR